MFKPVYIPVTMLSLHIAMTWLDTCISPGLIWGSRWRCYKRGRDCGERMEYAIYVRRPLTNPMYRTLHTDRVFLRWVLTGHSVTNCWKSHFHGACSHLLLDDSSSLNKAKGGDTTTAAAITTTLCVILSFQSSSYWSKTMLSRQNSFIHYLSYDRFP